MRLPEAAALGAIVWLSLGLRLSYALAGGLTRDEAQAIAVASLPTLPDLTAFLVHHESHPPLYFLLLRAWTTMVSGDDVAVIVPGVVLGGLTVAAAWWLARGFGSTAAGLLAALLVALSSSAIQADAMVRPYSLVRLLLLLAFAGLVRGLANGSRPGTVVFASSAVLLLYIHNWTVLPVASMGCMALWMVLRGRAAPRPRDILVSGGVVLLCWLPWVPSLLLQASHSGHLTPPESLAQRAMEATLFGVTGLERLAAIALWGGLAGTWVFTRLRRAPVHQAPASPVLVPLVGAMTFLTMVLAVLGSVGTNLLIPWVVSVLSPLVLVAAAIHLVESRNAGRLVATFTLVLVLGLSAAEALRLAQSQRSSTALMARVVSSRTSSEDLVLVMPSHLFASFDRYYRGRARVEAYPHGEIRSPVPFDNWLLLDTDSIALASSATRALDVLKQGGSVWQFATHILPQFRAASLALERRLTSVAGPPVTYSGVRTQARVEEITLRVWSRRP